MRKNLRKEFLDTMSRDPGNWHGPFYYNKKDPRLMVPKMHPSLGWTVNFARPIAYFIIILIVAIVYLSMKYLR